MLIRTFLFGKKLVVRLAYVAVGFYIAKMYYEKQNERIKKAKSV